MMENLTVTENVVRFLSLKIRLKKPTGLKSAYHFMAVDISFLAVVQRINGSLNFHLTHGPNNIEMSLVVRKPVFGVSDQVRHKPGCTATEDD